MERAFRRARLEKPAYSHMLPMLEILRVQQVRAREALNPPALDLAPQMVETKWREGFPILNRWDFPVDPVAAEELLKRMHSAIPSDNDQLRRVHASLMDAVVKSGPQKQALWQSFLHHDMEPWEEWLETDEKDLPSLLFLARSCIRPSLERTARDLLRNFPLPPNWFKGYCPVCGSLPSLLFLLGNGEKSAYCSWCGTEWGLHRLQCPVCDNRSHESQGYLYLEEEPHYRIPYCSLCGTYFKLIDAREWTEPPYFPLEEWITLHLDLLAQKAGWKPPMSPSPAIYGREK